MGHSLPKERFGGWRQNLLRKYDRSIKFYLIYDKLIGQKLRQTDFKLSKLHSMSLIDQKKLVILRPRLSIEVQSAD